MNQTRRWASLTLVLVGTLVGVASDPATAAESRARPAEARAAGPTGRPSVGEVARCLATVAERDACLDRLFRGYLGRHSTAEALALLRTHQEGDQGIRLGCHPVAHAIGRETFRVQGTIHGAFAVCDQTCHSGCYHGVVERFLLGDATATGGHVSQVDLKRKIRDACEGSAAPRLRFQCFHGLGHAAMFFTGYRLDAALGLCDLLVERWNQRSCYGGVLMENVFSATPALRDVSPTDYHYPCSKLDARYRPDCYLIQTWRMSEMGLTTEELFSECKKAGDHRMHCVISIGRDLSNVVRLYGPDSVARVCERRSAPDRRACIRGAVYALIDNTWDGRYAFPFCGALTFPEDAGSCIRVTTAYLGTVFERSPAEVVADCQAYLPLRRCDGNARFVGRSGRALSP